MMLLHFGQLIGAKALLGQTVQQVGAGGGAHQESRNSSSLLKNSGSLPKSSSMNCWAVMGVPSGCQKVVTTMF